MPSSPLPYTYQAFGLSISSEIALPELLESQAPIDATSISINLTLGEAPENLCNPKAFGVAFQSSEDEYLLNVEDTARYYLKGKESMTIQPYPNANMQDVRAFFYSTAISALLHQNDFLPIHASAVVINDRAVLFTGKSGFGKSSLAAAFHQQGYPVMSDDVIPIRLSSKNTPLAYPGYPRIKLWQDTINKLKIETDEFVLLREVNTNRKGLTVNNSFWQKPTPIAAIFCLSTHNKDEISCIKIEGMAKMEILKQNIFRYKSTKGYQNNVRMNHFAILKELANSTKVFNVHRPLEGDSITMLFNTILQQLK